MAVCSRSVVRDPVERIVSSTVEQQSLTRKAMHLIVDMHWRNSDLIRVYLLRDDHPLRVVFCKEIIGIYPHPLRLAWDRLSFSGTGRAPAELASEQDRRERVAGTPGTIGYLLRLQLNARVTVLTTE